MITTVTASLDTWDDTAMLKLTSARIPLVRTEVYVLLYREDTNASATTDSMERTVNTQAMLAILIRARMEATAGLQKLAATCATARRDYQELIVKLIQ